MKNHEETEVSLLLHKEHRRCTAHQKTPVAGKNIEQVQNRLSLSMKPEITLLIISKNILPLKYLKSIPIPITLFYEVTFNQYPF